MPEALAGATRDAGGAARTSSRCCSRRSAGTRADAPQRALGADGSACTPALWAAAGDRRRAAAPAIARARGGGGGAAVVRVLPRAIPAPLHATLRRAFAPALAVLGGDALPFGRAVRALLSRSGDTGDNELSRTLPKFLR